MQSVWSLKAWRERRIVQRAAFSERVWQAATARVPLWARLDAEERERLRRLAVLFLHYKAIEAAGDLQLTDEMRLVIALHACVPVLNLGLDWYRGWYSVIVYPDDFVPEREYVDEAGVVHRWREPLSGEAWLQGPVIVAWSDVEEAGRTPGYNVVIHELAHKLDMLDGEINGLPPLHGGLSVQAWAQTFSGAYDQVSACVESGRDCGVDPYAAEDPGEFFAVLSEHFFETPEVLRQAYPEVYAQLAAFYRQDPAARPPG